MDQKALLVLAAVVVVFLPQILAVIPVVTNFVKNLLKTKPKPAPLPLPDKEVSPDPAQWINDLYALQQMLMLNNKKDAADLVGQAIIKLVDAPTVTRTGGNRR